jgi:hypothetical protein
MVPQINNIASGPDFVLINGAGAANTFNGSLSASNTQGILAQMSQARVVSGGIRAFCLFPLTDAPGVLFAGQLLNASNVTLGVVATSSVNFLTTLPSSELGIGTAGARGLTMPEDPASFIYTNLPLLGNTLGTYTSSVPYIAGLGFPVGTTVWFEAILNLEGLSSDSAQSMGGSNDAEVTNPTLADYFPTPSQAYHAVRGLVGNSVVLDAALGAAQGYQTGGVRGAAVGAVTAGARSAFGQGRHYRNTLVSGQSSSRQGREGTVMIEEMKDGY